MAEPDANSSQSSQNEIHKIDEQPIAKMRTESAAHIEHAETRLRSNTTNSTRVSSKLARSRTWIGLHPIAPITEEHDLAEHSHLWWPRIRLSLKEPIAEFFGVFIMLLFGNGSVAQVLLSTGQKTAPGGDGFGSYNHISWGWGIGVMLGVYVAGDSGAYLNPAITFTSCVLRKLPWRRLPIYLIAQFLGGFISAGVVYVYYIDSITKVEGGPNIRTVPPAANATAGIFCTYPQAQVTKSSQFFSEFIESAILMFVIFALKDDSNKGSFSASGNWFPLGLFFLIFGLGACFGYNTGYAMNLARDFGPRLMSYAVGYGHEVWSAGGYYFWVPMVAPFAGCLFGGILYDVFLYTGPSPINRPYFGLGALFSPRAAVRNRIREQKEAGLV